MQYTHEQQKEILTERIWAKQLIQEKMEKIFFECENTREFLRQTQKEIQLLIENDF